MKTRVVGPFTLSSLTSDMTDALEAVFPTDIVLPIFHDISNDNINDSGGAWIALGPGGPIGVVSKKLQLSYTAGEPLEIGTGASAGAAARKFILNQGEGPMNIDCALGVSDQLWVRSLSSNPVTAGYITINLLG